MHLKNVIGFFGLWAYPFGLLVSGMCAYMLKTVGIYTSSVPDKTAIAYIAAGGMAAPCFVTLSNLYDYLSKGKTDFIPNLTNRKDVTKISDSKRRAMYKKVSNSDGLLSDKPEGLIFGTQGKKFVSLPVGKEGMRDGVSAVVLGSPGSGKSVFLINFLLKNFQQKNPTPVFCLDIKPELAGKSVSMADKKVKIVDFIDRSKAGWDVYFAVHRDTSDDEKMRVFDGISRALITSSNPKDKFFVNNARVILKFMLLYYFNKELGFVDSITKIISEDVSDHIKKILGDHEHCPEGSLVYSGLKKFADKDSEAMQDIVLTLQEHLNIFLNSDIRYQLRDNLIKACPEDLNKGTSVFVCLPMYLLDEYEDLLRLVVYQTISWMERRGESWKQGAVLILDELARLGRLENLLPFLAVNRSLGVSCIMAYQDFSQIEKIYSREEARTLMNLAEVTYVLSCKDQETTKILSDLIGEYKEEKISHNRTALLHQSDGKQNVSSEYRKIVETADFQTLREKKEAVLIVYGKYFRVKQFRYFEHSGFRKMYQEVVEANSNIGR